MRPVLRLVTVVVAAIVVLVPSAASAADEIGLSRDGVSFTPALAAPLFSSSTRWVPGDVRTERFFVRNNTNAAAVLDVDLRSEPLGELIASGDIRIEATAAGGRSIPATARGLVLLGTPVAAGSAVPVDVTVSFDAASTNETQNLSSQLVFGVRLTDPRGSVVDGDGVGTDSNGAVGNSGTGIGTGSGDNGGRGWGLLPNTGAAVSLWLLIIGATAVAAGAILARRPRKTGVTHV